MSTVTIFCPRSFKFYIKVYVIVMYDYTCELLCHYDSYSWFVSHITLSHQSLLHLQISNKLVSLCTSYYVVRVWGLLMSSAPMDLYNNLPSWVSYTVVYAFNFCEDKFLKNYCGTWLCKNCGQLGQPYQNSLNYSRLFHSVVFLCY